MRNISVQYFKFLANKGQHAKGIGAQVSHAGDNDLISGHDGTMKSIQPVLFTVLGHVASVIETSYSSEDQ